MEYVYEAIYDSSNLVVIRKIPYDDFEHKDILFTGVASVNNFFYFEKPQVNVLSKKHITNAINYFEVIENRE
jgi:hypothetical protein